jgi:sulfonate transport system permease protein
MRNRATFYLLTPLSAGKAVLLPAVLILLWEIAVRKGWVPAANSARASDVFGRLIHFLVLPTMLKHVGYSLMRLCVGTILGALLAVAVSLLLTHFDVMRGFVSPSLQFAAGVPIIMWMPFAAMLFGTGECFRIALAAISAAVLVYVLVFDNLCATHRGYLELAEMYEKSFWERVGDLYLPSSSRSVFVGARSAFGLGWIVLFFTEYGTSTAGKEGLAWFIADARQIGRVEDEFAGLLLLGCVAIAVDFLLAAGQARVLRWSDSKQLQERRIPA